MSLKVRSSYKRYLHNSAYGVPRETKRRHRRLLDLDSQNVIATAGTSVITSTEEIDALNESITGQSSELVIMK